MLAGSLYIKCNNHWLNIYLVPGKNQSALGVSTEAQIIEYLYYCVMTKTALLSDLLMTANGMKWLTIKRELGELEAWENRNTLISAQKKWKVCTCSRIIHALEADTWLLEKQGCWKGAVYPCRCPAEYESAWYCHPKEGKPCTRPP